MKAILLLSATALLLLASVPVASATVLGPHGGVCVTSSPTTCVCVYYAPGPQYGPFIDLIGQVTIVVPWPTGTEYVVLLGQQTCGTPVTSIVHG